MHVSSDQLAQLVPASSPHCDEPGRLLSNCESAGVMASHLCLSGVSSPSTILVFSQSSSCTGCAAWISRRLLPPFIFYLKCFHPSNLRCLAKHSTLIFKTLTSSILLLLSISTFIHFTGLYVQGYRYPVRH